MGRKTALIGFLAIQAISIVLWLMPLIQFLQAGHPLVDPAQQIWSGGASSLIDSNFRTGQEFLLAATFDPYKYMLPATLAFVAAGLAAAGAIFLWRRSKTWFAVGAAIAALLLGATGNWFVATQWQGDTAFPPGYLNADLLYAFSRAFNMQFFIGFALFAVSTVLIIAGIATRERPMGFQIVALNWIVIASLWLAMWVFLYVLPHKPALG
ncbi:MAG: hypothetical protein IT562_07465 [Alphaproteobacteria bacterium]|nr:hypothetical protein [Alphaproteobacteria bacterium]